tara:strand:+ start:16910 stop:17179 length:270 start_codon:yes stop_codon:yes gene_type:complete
MPKYVYHCNECNGDFEIVHGMTERQEVCILCPASNLRRIPQITNIKTSDYSTNEKDGQVGNKVKEAITENAEILKQQKKEATSWEYEPK